MFLHAKRSFGRSLISSEKWLLLYAGVFGLTGILLFLYIWCLSLSLAG
ncbi:hypothetical protein HU200_002484 [Digitaria exilis]|uniref:Uncharacterized protein n=1 Tax=Digitaria exilis TaxID=1010633 RepID=A0A835BKN6_9POAL|nr:hypothetical protein HU200_038184 [Digitaria exilis]KAF8779570.1 hypothetical protein HU200_002484 [Digitaria exilis]